MVYGGCLRKLHMKISCNDFIVDGLNTNIMKIMEVADG